ncbi:MAG: hypothetical protein KKH91_05670 [Elusimicrobia bacterium]|nr:hypothetical protein [Elusimicrobiota bacterium]
MFDNKDTGNNKSKKEIDVIKLIQQPHGFVKEKLAIFINLSQSSGILRA